MTDDDGRYRFVSIKPGAYPWKNHDNAWRPAHIHLSVFGRAFTERLVTQMYFPGDPLFPYDPIFQSVRDPRARERMISTFDLAHDAPRVGARLPLRRRARRQRRDPAGARVSLPRTPSQTVGPFFDFGLCARPRPSSSHAGAAGAIRIEGALLDGAGAPVPDGLVEIWQADADGRYDGALRLGALRRPTPTAASPSRPSSRARCASRTGASRRRTSACCASRAGCSSRC